MDGRRGPDERKLVALAREHDAASVKALYDAYVQYLAAVCRRYLSSEDDVKDVLQDSFVKIFSSLDRFEWRGEGSLRLWMRRIAVNEAVPLEVLQDMIRSLPEGYRTVFNLHVFEQLPHKEIAGLLGISENTSFSQFSRAKNLLARKIREYLASEGRYDTDNKFKS